VSDVPHRPEQRQYRFFDATDLSAAAGDGDGALVVEGYATTFGNVYHPFGDDWTESIDQHALDGADTSDVIFQYDHSGPVMARTRNSTLELRVDGTGLHVRADLSGSARGRELHEAIANGLVDRMSWGFLIAPDGVEDTPDGWVIKRVSKVYDVSAVSLPANDGTSIATRWLLGGETDEAHQEWVARRSLQQERMRLKSAAMRIRLNL
jgi:HK97 family phage prohead protease